MGKISFATCTSPIMHLICPPQKNLHNRCFSFLLGITAVQEKLKTMLMQIFFGGSGGEQIRCIMGDVQVANEI